MSPGNDVPKTPNTKTQPHSNNGSEAGDEEYNFNFTFDPATMSPATPYLLSHNAGLMQHTCPPKQTNQGLFSSYAAPSSSSTGRRREERGGVSSANLRAKLEAARRKTLAFKPRFGSPLSRS
jgi:hypothetical protein